MLDLSTTLYRIFAGRKDARSTPTRGIKHIIRPRVVYEYIPDFSQDTYPSFDSSDRVQEGHRITYGVTNVLISRLSIPEEPEEIQATRAEDPARMDYRQILRFSLEQSYNLSETYGSDAGSFSPVYARIEWQPAEYIFLDADAQWSSDEGRFMSRNVAMTLSDSRDDRLFIEHRFTKDATESIVANASLKLLNGWSVYGRHERNIRDGRKIKQDIGLLYHAQCWSLEIRHSEEEDDSKFEFFVNLFGLSDFRLLKPPSSRNSI